MSAPTSAVQKSLRALAQKWVRQPWRPLKPATPQGRLAPEVGKGVPKGGDGGTLE